MGAGVVACVGVGYRSAFACGENPEQYEGVVAFGVLGAEEERDAAPAARGVSAHDGAEFFERGVRAEFRLVLRDELRPAGWVFVEPLAEGRGRSNVLEPEVDSGLPAREAAGPEAIDKHSESIAWRMVFVDALDAEVGLGGAHGRECCNRDYPGFINEDTTICWRVLVETAEGRF